MPPTLHLDKTSLIFNDIVGGVNPASQIVNVTDTTPGSPPTTMNFTAVSDQSWLNVSPGSGSASATLTISGVTGSLSSGAYTGHILVTAPGSFGSPQTIIVTFNVGGGILGGFALIGVYLPTGI